MYILFVRYYSNFSSSYYVTTKLWRRATISFLWRNQRRRIIFLPLGEIVQERYEYYLAHIPVKCYMYHVPYELYADWPPYCTPYTYEATYESRTCIYRYLAGLQERHKIDGLFEAQSTKNTKHKSEGP